MFKLGWLCLGNISVTLELCHTNRFVTMYLADPGKARAALQTPLSIIIN